MLRRGWAEPLLFFFFKDDTLPKHKRYTLRSLKESWLLFLFSYANWFAGYTSQIFLSHWYQLSTNHVNKNRYVEICHWGILKQPADVKLYKLLQKRLKSDKNQLVDWQTILRYSGPVLGVCNVGWIVTNLMQCGSTSRHVCDK